MFLKRDFVKGFWFMRITKESGYGLGNYDLPRSLCGIYTYIGLVEAKNKRFKITS